MLHKIATEIAENKNGAAFYFRISNGRMSNSVCVYAVVMRERCVEDGAPMAVVHVAADEESAWAALLQKARGAGSYSGSLLPRAAWEDGERVLHHADADAEVWMAVAELPVGRPSVLRANSVAEDEDGVRRCAAPAWVRAEVE